MRRVIKHTAANARIIGLPKMRILQINVNKSKQAHDMALATARNLNVDVLILSEPNVITLRNRRDWIYDERFKSAVKILNNQIKIDSQGRGRGYSYVAMAKFTLFSCYSSGNEDILELEETLQEIETYLRTHKLEAIIAGDFNAKSPQWGMHTTDSRGQIMTDWMASNDLVILNEGNKPTFTHQNYGSILDLTISTAGVSRSIKNWDVLETESLSDHNYIMFDILEQKQVTESKSQIRGWQVKKLDSQKLQENLEHLEQIENYKELSRKLKNICDNVMPRRKKGRCKPLYWWNDEIARFRSECLRRRREYTRNSRRVSLSLADREVLWESYKTAKRVLRDSIKKAKKSSWKNICDSVDRDIWGDGYKIVMKGMIGYPPAVNLTTEALEAVVKHLFPTHNNVNFHCNFRDNFVDFTSDEMLNACSKLKSNRAPGPGNIPAEIIKSVVQYNPNFIISVYNRLAKEGTFPLEWKIARLVLLRKGNKPLENPSSFRPICLLDIEGKLFEHLLLERLNVELERTGGLSINQFGFRKGRQTIDAIMEVVNTANQATDERDLCVVVTLDVRNAFNSASWQLILEKLRSRGISESLIKIVASYLSERKILLESDSEPKLIKINSGVPQGSVMGPTLWNVLYDEVLTTELPAGVKLVGFADDIAVVAKAKSEELLTNLVNRGLQRVAKGMKRLHLELAPEKTEAVLLTRRRKIRPILFEVQGTTFGPTKAVKYLGVWLDTKMTFAEHVNQAIIKAEKTIKALSNLMPNIGGPRASKRKILSSVAHSQILYGAPVWYKVAENKKLVQKLISLQRKMVLRICSAYRTVSSEGACVIAGIPPIELQILERRERYIGISSIMTRENLTRRWQEKWDGGEYGRWTYRLIPDIQRWTSRQFGEVDYFLTQALTGHGCFRRYLYDRRRSETPSCTYCNDDDDVRHTLFVCPRWEEVRALYQLESGKTFNEDNIMVSLMGNEVMFQQAYTAIRNIIETKERESNTRNLGLPDRNAEM